MQTFPYPILVHCSPIHKLLSKDNKNLSPNYNNSHLTTFRSRPCAKFSFKTKNMLFSVIGFIYLIAQISLLFSISLPLSCYTPFIATSNQPILKSLHRISIRSQLHPLIPSSINTDLIDYLLSLYTPVSHHLQFLTF